MSKTSKIIVWAVVILIIAWVIWSFANKAQKASVEPIKIGWIGPLTGDGAAYGEPNKNMVALAVEEINSAGGINGRLLEVIYEDGQCSGTGAANAAQKLINVEGAQAIIGGFCSTESLSAVPIAQQGKVLLFSPGSSSPALTNISHYFFRDYPSDASQGAILAQAIYNKGWKKIALIQEQTDYALGVYNAFSQKFASLGSDTIIKESFASATTDFHSILAKLKSSNPNAFLIDTQTPAAAQRIFKQMSDLNWKPQIIIVDSISGDPDTVSKFSSILEGALTAEFGVDPNNPKFQRMISAYKTKYGSEPPFQSYAQTEYDSVYILRDGILAVGYNGTKLADWSRTIQNWSGASGSITIKPDGDRASGHRLEIIHNGQVQAYTQ